MADVPQEFMEHWQGRWERVEPLHPAEARRVFQAAVEGLAAQHLRLKFARGFGGDEPYGPRQFQKSAFLYEFDKPLTNLLQEHPETVTIDVVFGTEEDLTGVRLEGTEDRTLEDVLLGDLVWAVARVEGRAARLFLFTAPEHEGARARRIALPKPKPEPKPKPSRRVRAGKAAPKPKPRRRG